MKQKIGQILLTANLSQWTFAGAENLTNGQVKLLSSARWQIRKDVRIHRELNKSS